MPPKKKSKVDITVPPIWQYRATSQNYWTTVDAATNTILEKTLTDKKPTVQVTINNVSHDFNLKDLTVTTGGTTLILRRLQRGIWEYPDDQDTYVALYDDDNNLIEHEWRKTTEDTSGTAQKFQTKKLSWNKGYNSLYTYTFSDPTVYPPTAEQKNEDSGRVRKFRRSETSLSQIVWDTKDYGIANKVLPTTVQAPVPDITGDDENSNNKESDAPPKSLPIAITADILKVPDTWQEQKQPFERFTVPPNTPEWHSVIDPFLQKLKRKTTIVSLERLQNQTLWQFYALTRYKVALRNKGDPNEMLLYHGARVRENMDAIINYGFDMRVARDGLAGVGIYFAVHSSYSDCGYVFQDMKTKQKEMFQCRVTVGSCTKGAHGMLRPPLKSRKKADATDRYDSVHNDMNVMFIVFDNTQAYPEYVIKYTS